MKPNRSVVIFVHIPKTAGTTINDIFKNNYSEEEFFDIYHYDFAIQKYLELEEQEKEKLHIIKGHFPYGIHRVLEIPSYRYITILRDPVERVISQYHHSRRTPSDVYHDIFTRDQIELENCMGEGLIPDNLQVRYLAGNTKTPYGQLNEQDLEKAEENLTANMLFGISEMFDESLLWLNRYLRFDNLVYLKKHVTFGRPKIHDYPDRVIEQIKKHNALDIKLYEFARETFNENIGKAGQSFREELEKFKAAIQENNEITHDYFKGLKLLKENRVQEALSLFNNLLKHEKVNNEIRGEMLFLRAEHDPNLDEKERDEYYQQSLEQFLNDSKYNRLNMYRVASLYKRLGDYKKAAELFSGEIGKKRNTDLVLIAGCYFHLGEMALAENRTSDAQRFFSQCVSANPNHKKAREYLGNKKFLRGPAAREA